MEHQNLYIRLRRIIAHDLKTPPSDEASLLNWWTNARQSSPKTIYEGQPQ
jgi:hypothetical protein